MSRLPITTIIATPERSIIAIAAWRPRTKLAVFAIAYVGYWLLGALLGAGFSSRMATHIYSLVDSYVYGFALQERSMPIATPESAAGSAETILARTPSDEYSNLAAVGRELIDSRYDYGTEFEFGLDVILDGLAHLQLTG